MDLVLALENYADCARESQLLHVDFVTAFRQVVRILRETSGDEQYVHILEYLARLESISIRALEDYFLADDADTVLYLWILCIRMFLNRPLQRFWVVCLNRTGVISQCC